MLLLLASAGTNTHHLASLRSCGVRGRGRERTRRASHHGRSASGYRFPVLNRRVGINLDHAGSTTLVTRRTVCCHVPTAAILGGLGCCGRMSWGRQRAQRHGTCACRITGGSVGTALVRIAHHRHGRRVPGIVGAGVARRRWRGRRSVPARVTVWELVTAGQHRRPLNLTMFVGTRQTEVLVLPMRRAEFPGWNGRRCSRGAWPPVVWVVGPWIGRILRAS